MKNSLNKTNQFLTSNEDDEVRNILAAKDNTNYSAYGIAEGEDRALNAVKSALKEPLTSRKEIKYANDLKLELGAGNQEINFFEIALIVDYLQNQAGSFCETLVSIKEDESLEGSLSVSIFASGYSS